MRITVNKERSEPVYVWRDGEPVTLVYEARSLEVLGRDDRLLVRRVIPSSIFVIDDEGVRRIRVPRPIAAVSCFIVAALAMLWQLIRAAKATEKSR